MQIRDPKKSVMIALAALHMDHSLSCKSGRRCVTEKIVTHCFVFEVVPLCRVSMQNVLQALWRRNCDR